MEVVGYLQGQDYENERDLGYDCMEIGSSKLDPRITSEHQVQVEHDF